MIGGATTTRADIAGGDLDQARRENGWTATRTRVAIALFNSGLSAAEVAREIGGISRNGVIGKVHRSGLSEANRKASRAAGEARASRRKRIADASSRRSIVRPKPSPEEAPPPPDIVDQQIPVEQRRTLAQLDGTCCHWPVGDPQSSGFFFCGAAKPDDGHPYCRSHQSRSRQISKVVRRSNAGFYASAGPSAAWR